jgi:NAD(P)-dependent dehydrogenase (short-subunit alcohol dehydrogenase family)
MVMRVLITGGASGIGLAIAKAFLAQGSRVVVADSSAAHLAAIEHLHPSLHGLCCDLADPNAIEGMMTEAVTRLGGLDVLINNVGIGGQTAALEDSSPDLWEQVLRVNLLGTYHVTRLAIPHLKQNTSGLILIMSSVAGRFGYPHRSAYATSKWGLVGLTKSLSRELGGHGLRVNAILPGGVDGERIQQVLLDRATLRGRSVAEEEADALANQSLKYFVNPEHIAALAVFLASPAGGSISGQILPIDGDSQSAS